MMCMDKNNTRNVSHASEPGERSVGKAKTFEEWLEKQRDKEEEKDEDRKMAPVDHPTFKNRLEDVKKGG